jgi:hypothetical protein
MYGFGCGLLGFVSLTTLSLMSIEKYIEIKHSVFKSYLTRRKFKIGIHLELSKILVQMHSVSRT